MQVLKIISNDLTGLVISTLPSGKTTEFFPGTLILSFTYLFDVGIVKLL